VTLCPIDTKPVIRAMLSREDRNWLDGYLRRVLDTLAQGLSGDGLAWLEAACRPL
jgi:Xaa-Pro aminopeptidase